jgi:hypothetical protein
VLAFFAGRALLPQILFFVLMAAGWYLGRLRSPQLVTFLVVWLAGLLAAGLLPLMAPLFTAYVALVDVVLILVIFRGDIRI